MHADFVHIIAANFMELSAKYLCGLNIEIIFSLGKRLGVKGQFGDAALSSIINRIPFCSNAFI